MSISSLALTRKNASEDISKLAESHFQHDLNDADRDTLISAGRKFGLHTTIGSLLGLGLGVLLAFRVSRARRQMFNAFRMVEKPTHVKFADGREVSLRLATRNIHFSFQKQSLPVSQETLACFRVFTIRNVLIGPGRFTEVIPDLTSKMKPSTLGDVAGYMFFGAGGLFLGGETGLLTGSMSASRTLDKDPDSKSRIETAFKGFRADVLRKEADAIDDKKSVSELIWG